MMALRNPPRSWFVAALVPVALAGAALVFGEGAPAGAEPPQAKLAVLRIAATGTLTGNPDDPREKAGVKTLRQFIKAETGLENEVSREKDWRALAAKLKAGALQLGVFQGYEMAWAQDAYPELKPLAIAVNVHRYPVGHVLVRGDNAATDFAGLKGQSLSLSAATQPYLRLYLDRQCDAAGKKTAEFFGKVTTADNVEDALDDVVDGKAQATVIDGAAFDAYKDRKPGRFKRLKEVAQSPPFPPPVVACYGSALDEATVRRFKEGLFGAAKKETGELLLTLSRLTGIEDVPEDFGKVLAATRKAYPPPEAVGTSESVEGTPRQ
jgi:ABC-type phosphate/phosphonate transport system substrate-binding protein